MRKFEHDECEQASGPLDDRLVDYYQYVALTGLTRPWLNATVLSSQHGINGFPILPSV
jgi:hypothetical protein